MGKAKRGKAKHLHGLIVVGMGLLVALVGYGMWRSPELDWWSFLFTCYSLGVAIASEINRLIKDPFAILGLIVLVGGIVVIVHGWRLFRR